MSETPREIIAVRLWGERITSDALMLADTAIEALEAAGFSIKRLEQVGEINDLEWSIASHYSDQELIAPVYREIGDPRGS